MYLRILGLVLATTVVCLQVRQVTGDTCPIANGIGPCVELCSPSRVCQYGQKCCFNGCGTYCFDPGAGCPKLHGYGICVQFCSPERVCPSTKICCFNGCGHQCFDPVTKR